MDEFYDLEEIKNKKDINGNVPRVTIICGNRLGGKTTALVEESINNYLQNKYTTVWLYRDVTELESAPNVYDDVIARKYPNATITGKDHASGTYHTIKWEDGENDGMIGVAISLKKRDRIKKFRALFKDTKIVVFDEFMLEDGGYLPNECEKFISIYLTLISGGGEQYRNDIRFYMISNAVSVINPYFIKYGITTRLQSDTKIMRGDGWILHMYMSDSAHNYISNDPIVGQLSPEQQGYSAGDSFLIDTSAFITKPKGKYRYLYNIYYNKKLYAVKEYAEYICVESKKINEGEMTLCFRHSDFDIGRYFIKRTQPMFKRLDELYALGLIRFDSPESKEMYINLMAIKFI